MKRLLFAAAFLLATVSTALAGYIESQLWFDAFPESDRDAIQANLLLLGKYDGLVDGQFGKGTYAALTAFEHDQGERESGVLSPTLLAILDQRGNEVFERLEMEIVEDERAGLVLPVPRALLPGTHATPSGTRYVSSTPGSVLVTSVTPASKKSFAEWFEQLSASSSSRKVNYKRFQGDWFGVAGRSTGSSFYSLYWQNGAEATGFTFTWDDKAKADGAIIAAFLASYVTSLDAYRTRMASKPETPEVPAAAPSPPDDENDGIQRIGRSLVIWESKNAIAIFGEIDSNTPLEVLRALKERPEAQVVLLDSDGGLVDSALVIAHMVHDRKLSTIVIADGSCVSTCSFIFLAGDQRLAKGELGVHQVWNDGNDSVSSQTALSDVLEAFEAFGVQQPVVSAMLRTPPTEMHIFSPREIEQWHINRGDPEALSGSPPVSAPLPASGGDALQEVDVGLAAQALLLEASESNTSGPASFAGTVVWSKGVDYLGRPTIKATVRVPGRDIEVDLTIAKNSRPDLPASHLFEINFKTGDNFVGGSVAGLPAVLVKYEELVQGTPLAGAAARIVPNSFYFAMSLEPTDLATNTQLLTSRTWIDLALTYGSGKRAIMTLEKDKPAMALFREVVREWSR